MRDLRYILKKYILFSLDLEKRRATTSITKNDEKRDIVYYLSFIIVLVLWTQKKIMKIIKKKYAKKIRKN